MATIFFANGYYNKSTLLLLYSVLLNSEMNATRIYFQMSYFMVRGRKTGRPKRR